MIINRALMAVAASVVCFQALSATAADITVFRGGETEIVSTEANAEGGVTVLRGSPAKKQAEAPAPIIVERRVDRPAVIAGGSDLWIVTRKGRIRACWLQGTGYTNSLKIVCSRK